MDNNDIKAQRLQIISDIFGDNPEWYEEIKHLEALMDLFSETTGNSWFKDYAMSQKDKEGKTMMEIFEKYEESVKYRGIIEGIKILNNIYSRLLSSNRNEDVVRAIQNPEYLAQIMAEFGMKEDVGVI